MMGLNPGIASAYSIPIDEPDASLVGSAITATMSMYIIIRNRTAETSFDANPKACQNLGYLAKRSMVFMPSCVRIMRQGPYFWRCHLAAASGLRHAQNQIGT